MSGLEKYNKTNGDIMKKDVHRLGIPCFDNATELDGMLTHWICDTDHSIRYLFQPKGINPEDGQPADKVYLSGDRISSKNSNFDETVEIPTEIIGTNVTDNASGFTGKAIGLIRHVNGCFHVQIQPKGIIKKTGNAIKPTDFDLRQCSGEKINNGTEEEVEKSKVTRPSPTGDKVSDHYPSF